ncbi:MAG: methionyl-tRNA formyltransferase [Candidatus Binataceae bacterium]|nr:methionyl-tRNA formyltransferase [Candidatus Binataceae bacterium]
MNSGPPESRYRSAATPLRVVFMGTPQIAARILERLIQTQGKIHLLAGVVTQPDRPRRRGLQLTPSEVATIADRFGVPVLKPTKIRTPEFLAQLKALEPDVILVAAYGRILPTPVLEAARIAPINVHASILPAHRGASPVEAAILAGDSESGVTIMRVTEKLDAGPILLQRKVPLAPDETQGSLKDKLAEAGSEAAIVALEKIAAGEITETPQDESLATYTRPIEKSDTIIDWRASAVTIERATRAYDPSPVARSSFRGEPLLIYHVELAAPESEQLEPSVIVSLDPAPVVQCGRGQLRLVEVQAPGRRRMPAADFARGRRISSGERFGT